MVEKGRGLHYLQKKIRSGENKKKEDKIEFRYENE